MKLRSLLVLGLIVCLVRPAQARPSGGHGQPAAIKIARASSPFALSAAQRLEEIKAWDKAEEQYLKIGEGASAADRQRALDGIAHVHEKAEAEKRQTALSAAEALAETKHWKEAEQIYADLAKSDASVQKAVTERLKLIGPQLDNRRWRERFDELALDIGRVLLPLSLCFGLFLFTHAVLKTRKMIQFLSFRANSDDAAKQIAFWFERVLADLRSPTPVLPLAPALTTTLPFMALPGFSGQLASFDLEVGGTKIPFQAIYEVLGKPKARVSSTWYAGASGGALATIEKRHALQYVPFSFASRPISGPAGPAQDNDLQLFAYAVFIEAAKT
ncbi:MAG TPA: hypothetical protein VK604_27165 [Bryobacteraceae bacterium]|nr:hypothetical protein [Bryobacteraceae bacterium]